MDRAQLRQQQVIDLVSDDEDDFLLEPEGDDQFPEALRGGRDPFDDFFDLLGPFNENDVNNMIDLTGLEDIPDIDVPPEPNARANPRPVNLDADLDEGELVTEAACLQMVLDVLPDIAVDYVLKLIQERTEDHTRTPAACERIITQLLDGEAYPKEQDEANSLKRKRDDEERQSDFEDGEGNKDSPGYFRDALELLKDEFLDVPVRHLENVLGEHKTFFKSYDIVEEQLRNYRNVARTFTKITRPRNKRAMKFALFERGSKIPKELDAAKKKSEKEAAKRHKAEEAERAEEENLRQAQRRGEMGECQCCFDDFPINRMTSCGREAVHFFCRECAKRYVETEMGSGRCRPVCFADSSCDGIFTRQQLQQFLGDKSFERLEHMQQQQDLAAAGLDFLSECPFCDFKAECPPVEVDKEFRCMNPKCWKVSCRLCQKETHIPLSCEEAKKDGQLTVRHVVEEAMSAALIRHCNRCKHPFVKEYGCNKMTCSHCRNVQCYVCSKDVRDYNHFSDGVGDGRRGGTCPLHDNVEDRHEQEVKKAADEAMAKVQAENPDMSEADLMVQVSDRVKQVEQARRGRAQINHDGFPFHMAGGVLVNGRAQAPPAPPAFPQPPPQYVPMRPVGFVPVQYPLQQNIQHPAVIFPQYGQPPAQPEADMFMAHMQLPGGQPYVQGPELGGYLPAVPRLFERLVGLQAPPAPLPQAAPQPPPAPVPSRAPQVQVPRAPQAPVFPRAFPVRRAPVFSRGRHVRPGGR